MSGTGTATLNYGSCNGGTAEVFLDNALISSTVGMFLSNEVVFTLTDGAVLEVKEAGIIKMNSLVVSCTDVVCVNSFTCATCAAGKYKETAGNADCALCTAHASNCMATSPGTCDAGYDGTPYSVHDFSTRATMLLSGWIVNCSHDAKDSHAAQCQTDVSWAGFANAGTVGTVSTTMSGTGTATLNYGSCNGGTVEVFLDGALVSSAVGMLLSKEVVSALTDGAELEAGTCGAGYTRQFETAILYGRAISSNIPVQMIQSLNGGENVYMILGGSYTKMVTESCTQKYYSGTFVDFSADNWTTYTPSGQSTDYLMTKPMFKVSPGNSVACTDCLATMQHALLAPTATQRLGARPKERRLEVNAVCVLQVTLVLALAAQLGAWGLLLASIP
jgi:hypothetical protein